MPRGRFQATVVHEEAQPTGGNPGAYIIMHAYMGAGVCVWVGGYEVVVPMTCNVAQRLWVRSSCGQEVSQGGYFRVGTSQAARPGGHGRAAEEAAHNWVVSSCTTVTAELNATKFA